MTSYSPFSLCSTKRVCFTVWTISSERKIEILYLNLPGVVFINHDATLDSPSTSNLPPINDDPEFEASIEGKAQTVKRRIVAKIVVTSDSIEMLEGMKMVPLDDDGSIEQDFQFRVKNENAELKGSILTQVLVNDKNTLREFYGRTAEYVLGDAVLVRDDPTATAKVSVFNSASLYLSSKEGFSLRSFDAIVDGTGRCQLLAPNINIQNMLGFIVWGPSIMALLCLTISASGITSAVIKDGDVGVYTETLKADDMFSVVGLSGAINFTGNGAVLRQATGVGTNGMVNMGRIVPGTTTAHFGWSDRALVQAVHELDVKSLFNGTVEYANAKPVAIAESSWLWWRKNKTPSEIMKPATNLATKSYEFCDPPPRQLMPAHYFVNTGKFTQTKAKTQC